MAALPGAQGTATEALASSSHRGGTHPAAACSVAAAWLQLHTSSNSQWAGERDLKALCRAGPVEQSTAGDERRPAAAFAAAAGGQADGASLTPPPCERLPQRQEANELDSQLAQAGREEGAAAVLALIEAHGEQLTERNVVSALASLAEAACSSRKGGDLGPEAVVKTTAFQSLVGACSCCAVPPARLLPVHAWY